MSELILVSDKERSLKPLIQAALENELRLLDAGIRRSEQRLAEFEAARQMSTKQFIEKYEAGEIEETLELSEWIGEHRLLERLHEKADTLRGVKFAD